MVDLNRAYRLSRPTGAAVGAGQCYRRVAQYEAEGVDFECRPEGGLQFGLDMIPSLAVHAQTGCGADGCERGTESIRFYVPRTHQGLLTTESPLNRPDKITAVSDVQCLQQVKVKEPNEDSGGEALETVPVHLRDIALANDARWYDKGVVVRPDGTAFLDPAYSGDPQSITGDLLFVSLGEAGIFVFDVSHRKFSAPILGVIPRGSHQVPNLIGHFYVPDHEVYRLQFDAVRGLLFAGGYKTGDGAFIDVWDIRDANGVPNMPCADGIPICPEQANASPRPVFTLNDVAWTTNHLGIDATGIGLLYSWNRGEPVTARPFESPSFTFGGLYLDGVDVTPEGGENRPNYVSRPVDLLAPLGIPLERTLADEHDTKKVEENERDYTAAFKVRVALPGSFGESVSVNVQSLRALPDEGYLGAPDIGIFAALPGGPGWPEPEITVTLDRIGNAGVDPGGRYDTVYNLYESRETILVIADPRATRAYTRQDLTEGELSEIADEMAQCRHCEWPSYLPRPDSEDPADFSELDNIKELLVGGPYIRAFLTPDTDEAGFFVAQHENYRAPAAAIEIAGWADAVPSPVQASQAEPVLNPAMWSPEEAGIAVSLVSGELLHSNVDHGVPGRKLGFSFNRSYRSGVIGYGPLGAVGWNANLFAHLRFMPVTGEVEYHDGSGNVYRFLPKDGGEIPPGYEDDSVGKYLVPEGLYLRLSNLPGAAGWRLTDVNNNVLQFDEKGRLSEIRDRIRRSSKARDARGNTVSLRYNLVGELVEVIDDYGRSYTFEYDDDPASPHYGLLEGFEDFLSMPRRVEYTYDDDRRLIQTVLPGVTNKTEKYASFAYENPTISYEYSDTVFGDGVASNGADFSLLRLKGFKPPGSDVLRFEVDYDSLARVRTVAFPGVTDWVLGWTPEQSAGPVSKVAVTAPWGQETEYELDAYGRTDTLTLLSVPTLGPASSTPGPSADGIPARNLSTKFKYFDRGGEGPWKDGRVDQVNFPDGSYQTSRYREAGDRLAGAGVASITHHQGMARNGYQTEDHTYTSVPTEFYYDAEHGGVDNIPGAVSDGLGRLRRFAIPEGVDVSNPLPRSKTFGFVADDVVGTMTPTVHGRPSEVKDGRGSFAKKNGDSKAVGDANISTQMIYGDLPKSAPPKAGYLTEVATGADGSGRRTETTTPDEAGRVVERVANWGPSSKITYDEWDRIVRAVTGIGGGIFTDVSATVEMAYDERGRLIHQRRKQRGLASGDGWAETSYTLNDRDQVLTVKQDGLAPSVRDGGGLVSGTTKYAYLSSGLVDTVESPDGVTIKYEYAAGRVVRVSRVGVTGARHSAYDAMGRVVFTSDGDAGVWRGRYDAWGRLYEEELPTGAVVRRSFDRAGGLVREEILGPDDEDGSGRQVLSTVDFEINSFGEVEKVTEHLGSRQRVTEQKFDRSGRPTLTTRGAGSTSDREEFRVEYLEDESGRVGRVLDAGGNVVTYLYSGVAPWADQIEYQEAAPDGAPQPPRLTTNLKLDALGRAIREEQLGDGAIVTRTFDQSGNLLSSYFGGQYPDLSIYTYDSAGSVLSAQRPAIGSESRFAYDLDGRVLEAAVRRQTGVFEVTRYGYDDAGRLQTLSRPGAAQEIFVYNIDDTIDTWTTRLTNRGGNQLVLKHRYDSANRLLGVDLENRGIFDGEGLPDGLESLDFGDVYTWDALSRPLSVGRRIGEDAGATEPRSKVSYTYFQDDPRVLPEFERIGGWNQWWSEEPYILRAYDVFDSPEFLDPPMGPPGEGGLVSLTFGHDDLDRLNHVYSNDRLIDVTYGWGGTGRFYESKTRSGAGIAHRFAYEQTGPRLSALDVSLGGAPIGTFGYQWDGASNSKTGRSIMQGASGAELVDGMSWSWLPDVAKRLWQARSGRGPSTFGEDAAPLADWTFGVGSNAYGVADELLAITSSAQGFEGFDTSGPEGRLVSISSTSGAPETFGFDSMGRRTRDGNFSYTWDWRGRLKRVDVMGEAAHNSGKRVEYEYDASGRLLTRTELGAVPEGGDDEDRPFVSKRVFLWDGTELAAETGLNSNNEPVWLRQYVPGPSGLDDSPQVRVLTGFESGDTKAVQESLYGFIRDEMGTVIGLVEDRDLNPGEALPLLARYFYTPYGEVHAETGPELVRVDFSIDVTSVEGIPQAITDPAETLPGGVVLRTTTALDPATLDDGVYLERYTEVEPAVFSWQLLDPATYVVGQDELDPTWTLVMPVTGWSGGERYRVTVSKTLRDGFGRALSLPEGSVSKFVHTFDVGAPVSDPPVPPAGFPKVFPIEYDIVEAAEDVLGGDFPGGQNCLFQGLWTDPVTGIAYARNRWYDARTASWLSEDSMGAIDSPNLYAFVGWGPHALTDPMGTIGDSPAYDRFLASKDLSAEDREAFELGYQQGQIMGLKAAGAVAVVGASIAYAPIGIAVGGYYLQDAVARGAEESVARGGSIGFGIAYGAFEPAFGGYEAIRGETVFGDQLTTGERWARGGQAAVSGVATFLGARGVVKSIRIGGRIGTQSSELRLISKEFLVKHGIGNSPAARASSKRFFGAQKARYWSKNGPNSPRVNPAFARNLEYDELHHWAIPQNRWGKYLPNFVKHSKLNLMRVAGTKHARLDLFRWQFIRKSFKSMPEFQPYGFGGRMFYGTPTWAKLTGGAGLAVGGYTSFDFFFGVD